MASKPIRRKEEMVEGANPQKALIYETLWDSEHPHARDYWFETCSGQLTLELLDR